MLHGAISFVPCGTYGLLFSLNRTRHEVHNSCMYCREKNYLRYNTCTDQRLSSGYVICTSTRKNCSFTVNRDHINKQGW